MGGREDVKGVYEGPATQVVGLALGGRTGTTSLQEGTIMTRSPAVINSPATSGLTLSMEDRTPTCQGYSPYSESLQTSHF